MLTEMIQTEQDMIKCIMQFFWQDYFIEQNIPLMRPGCTHKSIIYLV